MRQAGVEPATDGLEDHCSIQLSYYRKPANSVANLRAFCQ